ncbi:response regulator transcription factor [Bacillota bacterium LX-D]|nr:response regulator transcription factor [Bacillota bacterium LX-D]
MHILVVDDDAKITAFLRRSLEYEGYQVSVAYDGFSGLKEAQKGQADLIILDLMLPGMDGFKICEEIRSFSSVPILMLTAKDEIKDRVKGLNVGADDYLVKPFALEELLARIKALFRRSGKDTAKILEYSDLSLNLETREVQRGERKISLTNKEFDLLAIFLRHPRQILTRDTLMDEVWGIDYNGESNVLEVFIGYLRQKLEANKETRLIHTVRGIGYTLRE